MDKILSGLTRTAPTSIERAKQEFELKKGEMLLNTKHAPSEKEIDKAAGGFESLLINEMLKSMWATVEPAGLMGENSNQAQIYRDMFNQSIADKISEGKGIGVKSFMRREISRIEPNSKAKIGEE